MLEEPDQVPMTFGVTSGTSIVVIRQIELVKVGQYLQLSLVGATTLHVRNQFPKFTKCLDKSTWIFFLIHPVGTVLSYVFYWIAVIGTLVYLKFSEVSFLFLRQKEIIFLSAHSFSKKGRTSLAGMQSAAAKKRQDRRTQKAIEQNKEREEYKNDGINALSR